MLVRLIAFLALIAPLCAQAVVVRGVVRPVPGPTICMQGETHFLEDTLVYLESRTLNLNRYNNQLVEIHGVEIGITCHVVEVLAVQQPQAYQEWCGGAIPGCRLRLKVCPGALGIWSLFLSLRPGYTPVLFFPPGRESEVLLLQPPTLFLGGGHFAAPCGALTIHFPRDPALVGLEFWTQGARMDIGPVGPIQFTNALRFRIAPFMPPCPPTNC